MRPLRRRFRPCADPELHTVASRRNLDDMVSDADFVVARLDTPIGAVPVVTTRLSSGDQWGAFRVRWGSGRMR
jgi:hypothetical protein